MKRIDGGEGGRRKKDMERNLVDGKREENGVDRRREEVEKPLKKGWQEEWEENKQ